MHVSLEYKIIDPQDAARWQGLAILLGRLRTPAERARFAGIYRNEVLDPTAEDALTGLLVAASALAAREEVASAPRQMAHVS